MINRKTTSKAKIDEGRYKTESILQLETPDGQSIPILVKQSQRASRFSLRFANGQLVAPLPLEGFATLSLLKEFILSRTHWILKIMERHKSLPPESIPTPCLPGASIEIHGEWQRFSLLSIFSTRRGWGTFSLGTLPELTLPFGCDDYKPAIEEALKAEALRHIPPLLERLAGQMGLTYNRLTLRSQRSRWGSCSSKRNISINWRVIHAPLWVQEYLLIHELAHLKEMNHSKRFWAIVSCFCPEYKEARKWFREHPLQRVEPL
ncbi:MAG: M48 family metallopeptidase [Limisphaerales bacterium]|jgi:predicted metal-dependent hydrolase|nr:SprT family zinc-dependent metalloprotease [Verrucomicrobiota bacterium]